MSVKGIRTSLRICRLLQSNFEIAFWAADSVRDDSGSVGINIIGVRAGTFLSNAAVLQLFGTNDQESARIVSELLGQTTVSFQTMGRALDAQGSGITLNLQQTGRHLLTPDEVRTMHASLSLLFVQGKRPILAEKLRYFAGPDFAGLFEAL